MKTNFLILSASFVVVKFKGSMMMCVSRKSIKPHIVQPMNFVYLFWSITHAHTMISLQYNLFLLLAQNLDFRTMKVQSRSCNQKSKSVPYMPLPIKNKCFLDIDIAKSETVSTNFYCNKTVTLSIFL